MNKLFYLFKLFLFFTAASSFAQIPEEAWDRTYGGDHRDGLADAIATEDGGAVLVGQSLSLAGGEKSEDSKDCDFWVIKVNETGNIIWDRTIGGLGYDSPLSVIEAADGGYTVTGYSYRDSYGWDILTVKLSTDGVIIWEKYFGNPGGTDWFNDIIRASDEGYICGGYYHDTVSATKKPVVVKLSVNGVVEWQKYLSGSLKEVVKVVSTPDGGYLLGGPVQTDITSDMDYGIAKIDAAGNQEWETSFGGSGSDILTDMALFDDGNYLLAGRSGSGSEGDKSSLSYGGFDYWIIKTDLNGNKIWDASFGGSGADKLTAVLNIDGGFLLGGFSDSPSGGTKSADSKGVEDFWVIKIDEIGAIEWDKTVGGASSDELFALTRFTDGSILLAGGSLSDKGGDKSQNSRSSDNSYSDYWVVKIDTINIISWNGLEPSPGNDATVKGDAVLMEDLVLNTLELDSGNSLTIQSGVTITINGDISGTGKFILSDGASLIMADSSIHEGHAEVIKSAWNTQKYNLMGSPVQNSMPEALGTNLYYYDESKAYGNDRWIQVNDNSLTPGIGYTSFSTGTATFEGSFNNGTINVDINRTEAGDDGIEGWNLIANPYPSAIKYDDFMAVNNPEVNSFIYLWDESGKDNYEYSNGDYLVYDGTTTVGGNGGFFNGYINSCQGFFVQKSINGSGTVAFTNAMRTSGNNNNLLKLAATGYPYFKVKIESAEGQINDLLVKFIEDALSGNDSYDAFHMKGNADLAFYSKIGDGDFIINALPQKFPSEVQLGLDNKVGTYTFSLGENKNLDGIQVYLEDISENIVVNLSETTYTVDLPASQDLQRFKLHVSYNQVLPVSASLTESNIAVFSSDETLFINDPETRNKEVKIVDLSGKIVSSFNYSAAGKNAFVLSLHPGLYLVNIQTADNLVSKKVQISR